MSCAAAQPALGLANQVDGREGGQDVEGVGLGHRHSRGQDPGRARPAQQAEQPDDGLFLWRTRRDPARDGAALTQPAQLDGLLGGVRRTAAASVRGVLGDRRRPRPAGAAPR